MDIIASDITDLDTLAPIWRALEERADGSFFQGWTWVGCLAQERFTDPVLVTARRRGVIVGLALFNRRRDRRRLVLGASGDPATDCVYVEHNGALLAADEPPLLAAPMIQAALSHAAAGRRGWAVEAPRLAGRQHRAIRALGGLVPAMPGRAAWTIDLTRFGPAPSLPAILAALGSNTRAAVRRSIQAYQAGGPIQVTRAGTLTEALAFLDELIELHQAFRIRRGEPGAFAPPFMRRFHQELIRRGLPSDEIDLLRIATPTATLGLVYNFRHRRRVSSYQSGFQVDPDRPREKPGLTSYVLCTERYACAGMEAYDLLVGDAAYKRSISNTYALVC